MRIKKVLPYLALVVLLVPLFVYGQTIPRGAKSATDIESFLATVADWLYIIGIAIVLLVVIIGGIRYVTAGGNEELVASAKKTIIRGLIGAAIILLAGIIVDTVRSFIETNV